AAGGASPAAPRPDDRGRSCDLRDRAGGAPVRLPRGADQYADRDGHVALAGVSGFTISPLGVNAGIGFPLAPLAGTLVAVILGLITAASALRVRGVSLAVVTLAAVVAITNFGFLNTTWGGGQTGSPVPELKLLGLDLGPRAGF